jgi:hypothetical protein
MERTSRRRTPGTVSSQFGQLAGPQSQAPTLPWGDRPPENDNGRARIADMLAPTHRWGRQMAQGQCSRKWPEVVGRYLAQAAHMNGTQTEKKSGPGGGRGGR